jgi:hypothetical protein
MDSNFVSITIPSDLFAPIIRLIAAKLDSSNSAPPPAAPAAVSVASKTNGWSPADMPKFRGLIANNKTALALLNLTSAHPKDKFNFTQVSKLSGRTLHESRADLRSLSMTVRKHFDTIFWPIKVTWTSAGETFYEAYPEIAEAWLLLTNAN